MRYLRVTVAQAATLVLFGAACSGGSSSNSSSTGAFPPQSEGNAIPKAAVVDLNKGAEPPMVYTQDFKLQNCTFKPHGVNPLYDPLVPGFRSVSEISHQDDEGNPVAFRKVYRVLDKTKKLNIQGIGKLEAAVVEEKEYENGEQIQLSLNWYAVCEQTNSVHAFGEDSFELDPDTGKVLNTEGSWLAGTVNGVGEVAIPSMAMPGKVTVGLRTIFDGAPGIALGGAEVVAELSITDGKLATAATKFGYPGQAAIPIPAVSAGDQQGCVQIEEISQDSETRKPDLQDVTNKVWCPGIGLVYDTSDGALVESSALSDRAFQEKVAAFKK